MVRSHQSRASLLGIAAASLLLGTRRLAQVSGDAVRIGVLTDMNGNLSSLSGKGSVVAAPDGGGGFRRQGRSARRSRSSAPTIRTSPISARRSPTSGSMSTAST